MKRSYSKEDAITYYRSLLIEQDKQSPHCYLPENVNMKDKTIVDCGVAEGNFILNYIEDVREAFFFEPDFEWIEALEKTYEPWKNKVHIIPKFVGLKSNGINCVVSLDDYFCEKKVQIDYIKMDIEGAELEAIKGAQNIIDNIENAKLLVCAYHRQDDCENIKSLLSKYSYNIRKGTMFMIWDRRQLIPFFRTGVMEFEINNE